MKKVAWLAGFTTLILSGVFTVLSLSRWEWNRALFFGLVLLVAEVGLATGLVMRRLGEIVDAQHAAASRRDPAVLDALSSTRPQPQRFKWLEEESTRFNVFITMLVGGGVVISALAWVVDRIAASTITPARERSLADELSAISYPRDGLLADEVNVLAQAVPHYDDPQLRTLLRRRQ